MSKKFERLFFALWPDQLVRKQLSEIYQDVDDLVGQGNQLKPANLHMTLHFLGNIPISKVDCFINQAEKIQLPSFGLEINRLGYFKKPKISWLGPVNFPRDLLKLQFALGEAIKPCGFHPESRPFQPHVTMARKIQQSVLSDHIKPVQWKVDSFALIKSISLESSVEYQLKASFPLLQTTDPLLPTESEICVSTAISRVN
ncbi:MAG: RNA 2',3'-cyclic phosphodiesterase [Gammaproteobacteria bacterium]|nr:RNA 2',3'-cyclic phosphodiesterase [Gammaproteobacteria bacterium]